ncbi:MAG: neutral/alkaline non-lysosomal ceramidase N-terminal domain-containing protein, partial [Planctomycetota bacterium]
MIAIVRGPGGIFRRLAAEVVPLAVGLSAGWMAAPHVGPWAGIGVGAVVWIVVSGVLVAVRKQPLLRRCYRLALLAHVVFWSFLGANEAHLDPPGPPDVVERVSSSGATTFRAGVGTAPFDLPAGTPLGGFGARPRRVNLPAFGGLGTLGRLSLRTMEAPGPDAAPRRPMFRGPEPAGESLGARALVLLPDDEEAPAVALVRLDLVVCEASLVEAVLERTAQPRLERATLLLSATHTHSGPGGFQRDALSSVVGTGHFRPVVWEAVVSAVVDAIQAAAASAEPARIAFPLARDRRDDGRPILARNRRRAEDDIDDRVMAMRLE